jgi:flagellar hook-associated protein 1 FlgK
MDSYSVGISGLEAAQKALAIIGNNIANAATAGYHRQRINLTPAYSSQIGSVLLGGGVDFAGVTRMIDNFLEQEILRQQSSLGQVCSELDTLRTVEAAFGELSTEQGGLSAAIDKFFNALNDLVAHPQEVIWQNQVISAAEAMAGKFGTLGNFLTSLETQITLEAENTIEQINTLTATIAELNDKIQKIEVTGGQTNNLRDQRDQCITELSELIGVETRARELGVVDFSAGGIFVVAGSSATELQAGLDEDGNLGITIADAANYNTNVQGGRVGGLLSLKNDVLAEIHNDLDDLAAAIIQQINQYHVQGVGSDGSFTELTGWAMASENLADFDPPVTDGKIYIRVTDTSTGAITRTPVAVDASDDSLSDIATYIGNNVANVSASVDSSTNRLTITAGTGYEFDFLPGVLSEPTSSNLAGDGMGGSIPTVTISGIYTGTENQTFTCTVLDDGKIGNSTLRVRVEIGADFVKEVNLGQGYAAGDLVDIGYGVKVSFGLDSTTGEGILNKDETITIEALASSDTSGVLAAVGINTFFAGKKASDMAVCLDISDSPGRIATALGAEATDNANILRMIEARDQPVSSLNGQTVGEFYRRLVADIGQKLSVAQVRRDNGETIVQNLLNQQSEISGVNINDEAAQMLVFEQMFQAMAKYLSTVHSSMLTIMEII